jgi:transposase-like protein
MGRETHEVWERRVACFRESGLTTKEFAAQVGVNARTLTYWAWRVGRGGRRIRPPKGRSAEARRGTAAEPVAWVEVVPTGGAATTAALAASVPDPARGRVPPPFELELGPGRTIRVPAGFDADALKRLIAVVEAG